MNSCTHVIQVTNVSPSTTSEQMRTLFGFLGNIEELKLFPPDDSPLPVTSRVCFVKFLESESVGVSQHLTNTVFVDRALIVVPFAEGVIPDESKAMSLLAPANAVAGMMPGAGLLPTPNPLASMGGTPFGAPNLEQIAAMGIAGPNMNPQALSADFLKLMQSMDPKLSPLAAGLNINPGLKNDGSNKEIEEAMKRVREAQSLISAAIEPGSKKDKRKHSRSRSRSRRRRSRSRSRHRRSHSRSRRRSHSRTRRKSKSPRRRKSHSRDRSRRSRSRLALRDRKEEKSKKRSKTPPKSYSSARRSRSVNRRHRRSRSGSRSSKKRLTRSPSPRRHKKEKKKDKDREKERERERREHRDQGREQRERSSSKKKSKDKERDHDRKSDSDKGDVKVTRDYDEEEQGYSSEKDMEEDEERKSDSDSASSPKGLNIMERSQCHAPKKSKLNGDDHHQEDMEMSD
ncbi:serine/arginine-rich splicing factor 11 isoform X1 [Syngnathus acus]|uniref:serine/arginine-rich splicing factor 11 isoform X1 n=2 Tax=Syngnathus acus TaxID=161584 RepID=UPI0018863F75|nr:serine/arginine-rich splicing factor 11 isoform X1 [Syngnathus acus]